MFSFAYKIKFVYVFINIFFNLEIWLKKYKFKIVLEFYESN